MPFYLRAVGLLPLYADISRLPAQNTTVAHRLLLVRQIDENTERKITWNVLVCRLNVSLRPLVIY